MAARCSAPGSELGVGRTGLAGCVAPRYPACSIFGVECASEPRMATERSETPAVTHPPVEVVRLRAVAPASPDRPVPRAASPGGAGGGGVDGDRQGPRLHPRHE